MIEIKDKNGVQLNIDDSIRIGDNRYSFVTKINEFIISEDSTDIMVKTAKGDFNINIVEKCQ